MGENNGLQRDEKPADFLLPDSVKNWFIQMYTHMISGNVSEMGKLYEREFQTLTNNYFKQSAWPESKNIEVLVEKDEHFLILYKQIYFRHYFSKMQPTMKQKIESWKNYCAIFDAFLNQTLDVEILPSSWLFDIVNEFVYQYQSFCQFRAKTAANPKGTEQEIALFKEKQASVWDTKTVLNYLHALVKFSKIVDILKATSRSAVNTKATNATTASSSSSSSTTSSGNAESNSKKMVTSTVNVHVSTEDEDPTTELEPVEDEEDDDASKTAAESVKAPSELMKELGYFSLICLSRAHVLYGDYYTSLKLLEPIDFTYSSRKASSSRYGGNVHQIYEKTPSCHLSVLYHIGFAQLMVEDFSSSIRSFTNLIMQVYRNRHYYSRFTDFEQFNKLSDKSLSLLIVGLFFCPGQKVNDHIHSLIREKYQEKQAQIAKGELHVLSELFASACPKFIVPASFVTVGATATTAVSTTAESEAETDTEAEATVSSSSSSKKDKNLQIRLFHEMVLRQQHVAVVRSYIKLYRSIDLAKLAMFRNLEKEKSRAELMAYKLNSTALKADVHFYISKDIVLVDDDVNNQRTGAFFMNQIQRFAKIVDECAATGAVNA